MYKLLLGMILALVLVACEKEKMPAPQPAEKTFALSGFTRVRAGETYNVTVKKGAAFSVVAKGRNQDLDDLVVTVETGNILFFRYNSFQQGRNRVDIEITLPSVTGVSLADAATGRVEGFGQATNTLNVALSGEARCTVDQLPVLVKASLSANSELTLIGASGDLIAALQGNAKLSAYDATFDDADVYTESLASAKVKVLKSLAAFASGDSRIYYKGSPASVNVEEAGLGKVIRE